MYGNLELFIDGKWHGAAGRKTEDVINPATEKPLASLPHASKADLEQVIVVQFKIIFCQCARDCISIQYHNTIVRGAQADLVFGADHSLRNFAPYF